MFALLVVSGACVLLLAWTYAGYPLLVGLVARLRPVRLSTSGPAPTLTIAIAVHDEAAQIAARITDVLAQAGDTCPIAEVLIGSDGSTDSTEAIVRDLAEGDARIRLVVLPRAGQTPTQHALFEAARGDVVVLSDAETRFAPGALANLAQPFRDPRVAAATGRLEWRGERATATSRNEGLYWRYERRVRQLESRAGWLTAVTGAFLAIRREAYRAVPAGASMDHLLPLYVREQGRLVVYVPSAVATDRPISGLREQFRSRARTATRGIRANLSMARRLGPWSHSSAALSIWSHKLLRWATPILIIFAAGAAGGAAVTGAPLAAAVPLAVLAWFALAGIGQVLVRRHRTPPRIVAFARAFLVVNAAFLYAWWQVLRGRQISTWRRLDWEARR